MKSGISFISLVFLLFLSSCGYQNDILEKTTNKIRSTRISDYSLKKNDENNTPKPEITITFSEYMNKTSVKNNTHFTITNSPDDIHLSPDWLSDDKLRITPKEPLSHDKEYVLTINKNAENKAGGKLEQDFQLTLSIGLDTFPPEIIETRPGKDSTDFEISESITITFDEEVSTDTLETAFSITLLPDNTPVTCTRSWGVNNKSLRFNPSSPLLPFERYHIDLNITVEDLMGNQLQDEEHINFITAGRYNYKKDIDLSITSSGFYPTEIVFDKRLNYYEIYVANKTDNTVNKYERNGTFLGNWDLSSDCGGIAVHHKSSETSDVYIAEKGTHRIRIYDTTGETYGWIGKGSDMTGFHEYDDTEESIAGSGNGEFNKPTGIAIGPDNNLYVVDSGNNRVQILSLTGDYMGRLISPFNNPTGIVIDTTGDIYVIDAGNNRIQKFNKDGAVLNSAWGEDHIQRPVGIAVDNKNFVYVTNEKGGIQLFDHHGVPLTAVWEDGYGKTPRRIAVDEMGDVYVCDGDRSKITIFTIDNE